MIQAIAGVSTKIVQRWLPDAFLFSIILTAIVFLGGILSQGQSPSAMVQFWGDGIWNLLTFSMQVMVTLVTGHVLAQSKPVHGFLRKAAGIANTPNQAIMLMTFVGLVGCWLNWGFGLIAGAFFAREIAQRVKGVHYPLLVASAYSGIVVWHAGLSGTIPLKIAMAEGSSLGELLGGRSIPVGETIFSAPVLGMCLIVLVTLPVINRLMMPPANEVIELEDPSLVAEEPDYEGTEGQTPAEKIENSRILALFLAGLGGWYLITYFLEGGKLNLNSLNLSFFVVGILFHGTPARYLHAINEAIKGTAGIVLQFPLYAGIMGMVVKSGLATAISSWFVSISTATTFPLFTFLSAGLVNLFVPSGGGQWAVQAPIVLPAAKELGVPFDQVAMAVAMGDAWTNMAQPFWALPLLAIAGLGIRDIMGYCVIALFWTGLVFGLGLTLFY